MKSLYCTTLVEWLKEMEKVSKIVTAVMNHAEYIICQVIPGPLLIRPGTDEDDNYLYR